MIVCLKDVVIHITSLDPFHRPSHDLWLSDEPVHVSCYPIVLLCVYVLKSNLIHMCTWYYTYMIRMFIFLYRYIYTLFSSKYIINPLKYFSLAFVSV